MMQSRCALNLFLLFVCYLMKSTLTQSKKKRQNHILTYLLSMLYVRMVTNFALKLIGKLFTFLFDIVFVENHYFSSPSIYLYDHILL